MASQPPNSSSGNVALLTTISSDVVPIPPIELAEFPIITAEQKTSLQIAKINSDIQDIDVNIEHINKLVQQIQYTTNCDNLQKIVKRNLAAFEAKVKKAIDHELKIIQTYLPIASLPSPDTISIVKWLGKLILGPISPQLEAQIKYAVAIVKLGLAVEKLVKAIEAAVPRLEACVISTINQLKNEVTNLEHQAVNAVLSPINQALNTAESAVAQIQNQAINSVIVRASSSISINDSNRG